MVSYKKVLGITAVAAVGAGVLGYGAWKGAIKPLKDRFFDSNVYHLVLTSDREPNKNLLNSEDLEGVREEREGDYGVAKDLETKVHYQFKADVPKGARLRMLVLGTPSADGKSLAYVVRAGFKDDGTLDAISPFKNAELEADVANFFQGKAMKGLSSNDKGKYFGYVLLKYEDGRMEREYFELNFDKDGKPEVAEAYRFEVDDISLARKAGVLKEEKPAEKAKPVEEPKPEIKDAGITVKDAGVRDAGKPEFKMEFRLENPQ